MTDREKVIKELEYEISRADNPTFRQEWIDCVEVTLLEDALALLKAQEPRVMTLDEVKQHDNQDGCVWFEQPTYNAVAAFVRKEDFVIEVISPYILGEPINHGEWLNNNYNITWRCWTSRPTDEQMEKEPWNGYTDVT